MHLDKKPSWVVVFWFGGKHYYTVLVKNDGELGSGCHLRFLIESLLKNLFLSTLGTRESAARGTAIAFVDLHQRRRWELAG